MLTLSRSLFAVLATMLLAGCQRPTPDPTTTPDAVASAAVAPAAADPAATLAAQRATQAAIWGMPAVNYDLMRQQMLGKTQGKINQVIY